MSQAASEPARVPTTLGRYQLLGEIARGGAARVYLAVMRGKGGFERVVAVKVLHKHLAADAEFIASFLDEARLAARIRHPNVVDVYDVDAIEGELIIVMSYVEGTSLSWILAALARRSEPLPVGVALRIVYEALLGLHAAHELLDARGEPLGLVHRDVSPQNVLCGTDGVTRVTDFGVAKAKGRLATTAEQDVVKGKLRYLAPEQVRLGKLDRRVDVFAAGIVLWEALVGRKLFDAGTETEALAQVLTAEVPPPSAERDDVPAAIDAVCLKALARRPDERYATAADFAYALEDAAGSSFARPREVGALVSSLAREGIERARRAAQIVQTEAAADSSQRMVALLETTPTGPASSPGRVEAAPGRREPRAIDAPTAHGSLVFRLFAKRRRQVNAAVVASVVLLGAGGLAAWWAAERARELAPPTAPAAATVAVAPPTIDPVAPAASVVEQPEPPASVTPRPQTSARPAPSAPAKPAPRPDPLYIPPDL